MAKCSEADAPVDGNTSSDESDEEMPDYVEEIKDLKQKLSENASDYNSHTRLVEILHKSGELEELRVARQNFSKQYPLTPQLWLQWINDEKNLGVPASDIEVLFERSIKDYVSFDLWFEYVQWACSFETQKAREIFERAITQVGFQPTSGCLLWDTYRVFEQALLGSICSRVAVDPNNQLEEEMESQKSRVLSIFKRQLGIPLANLEDVYNEYIDFIDGQEPEAQVVNNYKDALRRLPAILENESNLENESSVKKFVELEKHNKDPSRIQLAYERAITKFPLRTDIWVDYLLWLDNEFKIRDIVVKVYARAVRNVSWDAGIWRRYLLALERAVSPLDKVERVFAASLEAGFTDVFEAIQLWINYIFVLKRYADRNVPPELTTVAAAFTRAKQYLIGYFKEDWDPEFTIRRIWARFAFEKCNDSKTAADCWREIMAEGNGRYADYWIEYLNLQKLWKTDLPTRRKLFYKAVNSVSDYPDKIGYALLQFEREEGTVLDLDSAEARVITQMKRFNERGQKKNKQRNRMTVFYQDDVEDNRKPDMKRKSDKTEKHVKDDYKKLKDSDGFAVPNLPSPIKSSPIKKKLDDKKEVQPPPASSDLKKPQELKKLSSSEDTSTYDRTVFVSNLEYTCVEETLRSFFEPLGKIEEIRIPKKEGARRHKGFAYVQFEDAAPVPEALKLDRAAISGRPMYVSRCKAATDREFGAETAFKFGTGMQKNKLFVKNISFSATKEQLMKFFEPFGSIKDIRLVTYKNGASKGICFVEFENEADASKALVKTDETLFMGKRLSVAISNPPPRAPKTGTHPPSGASKTGTSHSKPKQDEFLTRGKGASSRIQMVPRNLVTKSAKVDVPNGEQKKMSNQQFRDMMLKK